MQVKTGSISTAVINEARTVLTLTDNATINAGTVRGEAGEDGAPGQMEPRSDGAPGSEGAVSVGSHWMEMW